MKVGMSPLGLRPRWFVDQLRIREILEALDRYNTADMLIPMEWVDELREIVIVHHENRLEGK